jgi:hypothetical protein
MCSHVEFYQSFGCAGTTTFRLLHTSTLKMEETSSSVKLTFCQTTWRRKSESKLKIEAVGFPSNVRDSIDTESVAK